MENKTDNNEPTKVLELTKVLEFNPGTDLFRQIQEECDAFADKIEKITSPLEFPDSCGICFCIVVAHGKESEGIDAFSRTCVDGKFSKVALLGIANYMGSVIVDA